jgi:hypothetical protein
VPFLITSVYRGLHEKELAEEYVKYCLQNCDWNPVRFKSKSPGEKQNALAKLLASTKWRQALTIHEKEFLAAQIQ